MLSALLRMFDPKKPYGNRALYSNNKEILHIIKLLQEDARQTLAAGTEFRIQNAFFEKNADYIGYLSWEYSPDGYSEDSLVLTA